jgi:hypothetical protein
MSTALQVQLSFEKDIEAIDPEALAAAMGGREQPPEEPLLSSFEEGFGYHTSAAVGRTMGRYVFARKVRTPISSSRFCLIIEGSSAGQLVLPSGSRCEFPLSPN